MQADHARLDVGREPARAEQLRLGAVDLAARVVHLEEAVAAVDVALREREVEIVLRRDVPDAVAIGVDRHGVAEAGNLDLVLRARI